MFCKKILSIVGLIFLGSQLNFVAGACVPTYEESVCAQTGCEESDANKLFLVESSDSKNYAVKITNDGSIGCVLYKTNVEDYCLDESTGELLDRKPEYCKSGTECSSYYSCTNGECENTSTSYAERGTGDGGEPVQTCDTNAELIAGGTACTGKAGDYYFIANASGINKGDLAGALNIDAGATGYLYKCTIAVNGDSSCEEQTGLAGYFANQNDGSNSITYIQCTPAAGDLTTCIGLADAGLERSSCESAGQLIKVGTDYKLCVKNSALDTLDTAGVAFEKASYFVDASVTNAFNDQALPSAGNKHYYVVVDIDTKSAVVQRYANAKKYKYAVVATNKIVEKAGAEIAGICNASSEFQSDIGHEFQMTKPKTGSDNVNYYIDLDRASA